jgi:hypothetical protein
MVVPAAPPLVLLRGHLVSGVGIGRCGGMGGVVARRPNLRSLVARRRPMAGMASLVARPV